MISTVLVPLDGSAVAEQAIPYARALLPEGGTLVLLRVLPEAEPALTELHWSFDEAPDVDDAASDAARTALEQVIARMGDTSRRRVVRVARGDPAEQILRAIARHAIDVVVMTTHGRGAIGRAIFGSVADRVSRASPVPILLVRSQPSVDATALAEVRRLLVPLDGSDLAEAALPLARELAQRLEAPVHLVQAVDFTALLAPVTGGGVLAVSPPGEVYQELMETIERGARDYLASVAARLEAEGMTATWAVLDGSPYFAIADAAEPGDLIVLTSHGRSGVLRWLMGSVAEKLVREAPVPALLVPSAGRGMDVEAS